jgi:multiple sugar transport system substrate-binding protein
MFLELTEMAGAHVFTGSLVPKLNNEGGRWALGVLRELYADGCVPLETLDWHFDEVHQCFRDGRAAMVCDWPGYYASYRDDSPVSGRFRVARLPAGPGGVHIAYAGCHTFALTCNAQSQPAALDLLRFLTAPEQQTMEARQGSVPVRASVMAEERSVSAGDILERLNLLETAIASDVIIPPPLARYPEVENIVWKTARSAILGQTSITAALEAMESGIARVLN